jgi:hypothetical protein|uniref:Uncharacterized protein n=1 Tax=Leviviridae sp. TaxID=2027243 RepID=A0A514D3A9_9VIRU|nr:MAG: hypothetical protein H3Bulk41347_000002 [Leviviridae sp.]
MFAPASPVTGAPITGLTSPTYTLAADTAPDVNGKAYAVTALGGTQTGVVVSSASYPFTVLFTRPKNIRQLPALGLNGRLPSVPRNTYTLAVRKGVKPLSGQPAQPCVLKLEIPVPAGADLADAANLGAALSLMAGVLWEQSDQIYDSIVAGTL